MERLLKIITLMIYILSYVHCVCWTLYATNNFAKLIAKYSNQNVASFADALWDRQAKQLPWSFSFYCNKVLSSSLPHKSFPVISIPCTNRRHLFLKRSTILNTQQSHSKSLQGIRLMRHSRTRLKKQRCCAYSVSLLAEVCRPPTNLLSRMR